MGTRKAFGALWALGLLFSLCGAQSSVPVATEPIVSSVTVETVVQSLLTIYSVATSTQPAASPASVSTIVTVLDGQQTTILATASGEASARPVVLVTNTIISTFSVTTSQIVESTVGFTTIFSSDNGVVSTADPTGDASGAATSTLPLGGVTATTEIPPFSTGDTINPITMSATGSIRGATSTSSDGAAATATALVSGGGSSTGLSAGAKAGIGVGAVVGVTVLVVFAFLFGQRYSRRRNRHGGSSGRESEAAIHEKDAFQAGRPYELTGSNRQPAEMSTGKMHPYSFATSDMPSGSESTSGRSYEMPGSAVSPYSEPAELSALPQFESNDPPVYVGVPSHMSGTKHWSMKEYEKS